MGGPSKAFLLVPAAWKAHLLVTGQWLQPVASHAQTEQCHHCSVVGKTEFLWPLAKLTCGETQVQMFRCWAPNRADGDTTNTHQPNQPFIESNPRDYQTTKCSHRQRAPRCAGSPSTSGVLRDRQPTLEQSVTPHAGKMVGRYLCF